MKVPVVSNFAQHLFLFNFSHSIVRMWFNLHFLTTNEVEHFFSFFSLLIIMVSSFDKCLFKLFALF